MGNEGVSLKPSDAVAGGGLLDDCDVEITGCRFRTWDYNGKIQTPVLGLSVKMALLDGTGETEQVYSAGDLSKLVPSPDGKEAVSIDGSKAGLGQSTNAMMFLVSLVNAGFPEHLIGRDISVFEGTKIHVNRVPQPKRSGVKGGDGSDKDIVIATKLLALPGGVTGTGATAATAGKAKGKGQAPTAAQTVQQAVAVPAATGASDDAVNSRATEVVMEILGAKGGSIAKSQIAGEAFKILNAAKDPLRNAVAQLVFKDEFLTAGPWQFDGTTVSMG